MKNPDPATHSMRMWPAPAGPIWGSMGNLHTSKGLRGHGNPTPPVCYQNHSGLSVEQSGISHVSVDQKGGYGWQALSVHRDWRDETATNNVKPSFHQLIMLQPSCCSMSRTKGWLSLSNDLLILRHENNLDSSQPACAASCRCRCPLGSVLVNYPLTHMLPPSELQILADIQTYYNHHYQFAMHKYSHASVF